nr:nuclear hormone receptor FTZ-F1 isoform X3 [Halyomorpha halys]
MREDELTMSVPTSSAQETSTELESLVSPEQNNSTELQVSFSTNASGTGGGLEQVPGFQPILQQGSELPDTKEGIEELCPVCGDKVSGYHYGLLTCESCKGFFKRTVQNKKVYTCVAERSCHIDKTQRKRCPFCRFQKCLDVGMKLEAVRADRMRGGRNKFGPMYKRDRARKLQMIRQRQMAIQTLRNSSGYTSGNGGSGDAVTLSYTTPGSNFGALQIKQEIQIPQVSSLTSSPDSSPSPIAVALGQQQQQQQTSMYSAVLPAQQLQIPEQRVTQQVFEQSKLWPTNSPPPQKSFSYEGSSSGNSQGKVSPMIRDFVLAIDDQEWQNSLYNLLQNQTYNQCEVDLFELMCKVLDQNLFSQVDWARNSTFFKDLKQVDDQMKLLQHSWSDMLVLDHMHHRMHNNLPDEATLPNGQKFDLLSLGLLGVPNLAEPFTEISTRLQDLKFDTSDYISIKFLLLLNPDVRGLMNRKHVQEGHDQVQQALHDYCLTSYPQVQDKFNKLLMILPEIHSIAVRGEEHLYMKHCNGGAPTQTLLMEMLHAKRK